MHKSGFSYGRAVSRQDPSLLSDGSMSVYDVKSILRISVYVCFLVSFEDKCSVSTISSAFWEEVPKGRGWDTIILVSETTAYPATSFPSDVVEELPSIYQVKPGLFKGVDEMWEKQGIRSSNACKY